MAANIRILYGVISRDCSSLQSLFQLCFPTFFFFSVLTNKQQVRPESTTTMRVLAKFIGYIISRPFSYDSYRNTTVDNRQIQLRNTVSVFAFFRFFFSYNGIPRIFAQWCFPFNWYEIILCTCSIVMSPIDMHCNGLCSSLWWIEKRVHYGYVWLLPTLLYMNMI